ncbi:MAG: hypothetical protein HGA67_00990 [Candidatus Yonathbacteria bacterium]|nr:hypothetical protein [Candidatus Yonathbacteria bacterium]
MTHISTIIMARVVLIAGMLGITAALALARTAPSELTFACEGLELKVDSRTIYNGTLMPKLSWSLKNLKPGIDHFFNFPDIKPGDTGTTTISLHPQKSNAWMCLDFTNLEDKENGMNEPESSEDKTKKKGELSKRVQFFAWIDDGDNVFEVGEKPVLGTTSLSAYDALNDKTYTLADTKSGPAWRKDKTRYVGVTWCAGRLTVDVVTARMFCDGTALGNQSQTDSFSFDVALRAVPAQDNPKFVCNSEKSDSKGGHDDKRGRVTKDDGKKKDTNDGGKQYTWYQKAPALLGWSR